MRDALLFIAAYVLAGLLYWLEARLRPVPRAWEPEPEELPWYAPHRPL